eukprot:2601326-Rhodomonas_salina.1
MEESVSQQVSLQAEPGSTRSAPSAPARASSARYQHVISARYPCTLSVHVIRTLCTRCEHAMSTL